jgi:hypothetical protein
LGNDDGDGIKLPAKQNASAFIHQQMAETLEWGAREHFPQYFALFMAKINLIFSKSAKEQIYKILFG